VGGIAGRERAGHAALSCDRGSAMGSRQKVRQFLEESDSHRHYSSIVEHFLTYLIAKAEKEGNARFAADLRKAKDEYHEEFNQAIDITESVYAEIFTDDELDDLIILHNNPALKKARSMTAEIVNGILKKYVEASA
jgi:preprotein translocase subunit SecA